VPEVVGDCGIYVDTNNPVELSDKIIYLLKNKKVRDSLGQKARERIEGLFSLSIRRDKLKKIFEIIA
jgi:glycosyltransferase involved in cell wall biosynthesis